METIYINIGNEKCAFFVHISKHLLHILKKYPLLHRAVEESVISAEKYRYYSAGILAFSQLLNVLNEATPEARHVVAHNFLKIIPQESSLSYRKIEKQLKEKLEEVAKKELNKSTDKAKYLKEVQALWDEIYSYGISFIS